MHQPQSLEIHSAPVRGARAAVLATMALGLSLGFIVAAGSAVAAGGGGDGGGGSSGGTRRDMTTCKKGEMWSIFQRKCVPAKSGQLPDSEVTDYAFALAEADRYDEALQILDLLQNPKTAKALNYRGYATRKLGRTKEGIGYYLQSVALDPHYAQVREYLGEAYVIQGRRDLAAEQLKIIETLCGGTECEEYEDLAEAIKTPGGL